MTPIHETIPESSVLLLGKVGSQAYGMATPESDTDYLGIFAWPTEKLLGLGKPHDSLVTHEPDVTMHEIGKWCRLAISCNPTAMEIVWLPDYEVIRPLAQELIRMREAFLSAQRVRDAYLGYATQQFRKLQGRGDGTFDSDLGKRTAKHARHLLRLCQQGTVLHTEGQLRIEVEDPQYIIDMGDKIAEGEIWLAEKNLRETEETFDRVPSALPSAPNTERIEDFLIKTRHHYF